MSASASLSGGGMSNEAKVIREAHPPYRWIVIRPDGERAYFEFEDAAWKYVIRGDHLRPMKKDIKTYVEGVEIPKPKKGDT